MSRIVHRHETWDEATRKGVERPPEVHLLNGVTEVVFRRGEGCCDTEVVRECHAYYDDDGVLLAIDDPMEVELAVRRAKRDAS